MNNENLLDYLSWADNLILDLLGNLHLTENGNDSNQDHINLIRAKLLHLTEEYRAWLCDIKGENFKNYIESYQEMNIQELSGEILTLHRDWNEFLSNIQKNSFEIDEGDFVVKINLDEVIFNLVNHASYHRGQIVVLLRLINVETPISDFYWFKIHQLDL